MRKIYASFILFFGSLTIIQAQSLTQANNAPAIGDIYRTTDVSTLGVSPGTAGPAETWNMSVINVGTVTTDYSVVAVPSSSAASYPSASLAVQTGTTSNYQFYTPSSTELTFWGGSISVSTVNVIMTYTGSSAAVVTTYSMGYNTTNSNPVSGTLSAFSQSGTFSGTCSVVADGTGTLNLPGRNFTNVLRKKTTQDLAFSAGIFVGTIILETYEYFSPALSKSALFTISNSTVTTGFGPTSQMIASINADYQTIGINEKHSESISFDIFPNPSKNNFHISLTNENAEPTSYELISALGQTVKKSDLGNEKGTLKHNVNITDLQAGIYFVRVHVGPKTSVKKLTIQ